MQLRVPRLVRQTLRGLALGALGGVIIGVAPAMAHGAGLPTVIVPLDHVVPGVTFQVLLSDFPPGAAVHITITSAGRTTVLADATMGSDGHGEATATLPSTFPFGYVQVIAAAGDGSAADTWIRIGDSTYSSPGSAAGETPIWEDPSFWILAVFVLGVVAALTLLATRARRQRPG